MSPPKQQVWFDKSRAEVDRTLRLRRDMFEDENIISDRQLKELWLIGYTAFIIYYNNWVRRSPVTATTQVVCSLLIYH